MKKKLTKGKETEQWIGMDKKTRKLLRLVKKHPGKDAYKLKNYLNNKEKKKKLYKIKSIKKKQILNT